IVSRPPRLYWIPVALIAVNLAFVIPCWPFVAEANQGRFGHVEEVRDFARAVKGVIVYDDGADPWCNTVLADRYSPCFAGFPPGIGVRVCFQPNEIPASAKSKYLLVDASRQAKLKVQARPLRQISVQTGFFPDSADTVLLQNTRAPCELPP